MAIDLGKIPANFSVYKSMPAVKGMLYALKNDPTGSRMIVTDLRREGVKDGQISWLLTCLQDEMIFSQVHTQKSFDEEWISVSS